MTSIFATKGPAKPKPDLQIRAITSILILLLSIM